MARHKQECIRLPYTAALASQRAFFVKVLPPVTKEEPKRGDLEPEPVGGGILSDPGGVGRFPLDLEAVGLRSSEEGREPVGADHLPGTAGVRNGSTEPGFSPSVSIARLEALVSSLSM